MRLLLALFLGLTVSGQAVTLAPNTYSLHFDNLCNTENSGADASANADTWTLFGSPTWGTSNPTPYEGAYYLSGTSAVNNLTVSAGLRTALENATSWSFEGAFNKITPTGVNQYVYSFDDAGLTLLQIGQNDNVIRIRANGIEVSSAGAIDLSGTWNYIFVEGNTTAPYLRVFVNGVCVTGTATAGAGNIGASTIGRIGSFHSSVGGVPAMMDAFRWCIPSCTPPGPTRDPNNFGTRSPYWENGLSPRILKPTIPGVR